MKPGQFSIRWMLAVVAIIAGMLAGIHWFFRSEINAKRDAVIQAIRAGRIELEPERQFIGEAEYRKLRAERAQRNSQN
jgi:hypothetical protein